MFIFLSPPPPHRNLPRANVLGVLLVTVIYVLANISYLAVLGTDGLLASSAVALVRVSNTYSVLVEFNSIELS